ncbi:site-specific recombinase [[Clostridium] innocuum]|nr:site-specific recombinase [[Clostridium] innocuum]
MQETELQAAVMQAINTAYHSRDAVLEQLQQNIDAVLSEAEQPTDNVDGRLEELLKLANSNADYTEIADEIDRLREMKQNALVENAERDGLKQRITEMVDFLKNQDADIESYDEALVRKMIEKVTVYEEKFVVEFKAGISLEVER